MKDGLTGFVVAVEDRPVPAGGDPQVARDDGRPPQHRAHQHVVVGRQFVQRRDMAAGYDQDMHRGLRVDIIKGKCAIVAMDDSCRNGAFDNLAKDTIGFRHNLLILNSKVQISNRESQISNLKSEISNLESQISNFKSEISNLESQILNFKRQMENVPTYLSDAHLSSFHCKGLFLQVERRSY